KMFSKVLLFLGISMFLLLSACVKPQEFSVEPYIEFRENTIKSDLSGRETLYVKFYFQDGDGDIGRYSTEETPPYVGVYKYNLYFLLYEKMKDTTYQPVYLRDSMGSHCIEYPYIIKYIEPVNSNKAMSGTITWEMNDFQFIKQYMKGKTIRFNIFLYDRSLHKSNVISTSDILVR
ncbi:MAG: hypothetical protein RSA02_03190, partial [Bacteroidales bacterium]